MVSMLKKIGKEWTKKEEGGMFTADHLSPSQLKGIMKGNKIIDLRNALNRNIFNQSEFDLIQIGRTT